VPERSRPLYERAAIPLISSRAGSWFYVYVAPHLDRGLLRLTGGRFTTAGRGRVGFLRVRGARSGVERITPLVWTADGESLLLVASRGGDIKHPAWYRNLITNPEVGFSIDGTERHYRARVATAAERPRLWELVNRRYPGYAVYQQRAGAREIPIMVLEPRPPPARAQLGEPSSS
jgi:deazaflavin-dependent oxidoreductase (nitroreductase family)